MTIALSRSTVFVSCALFLALCACQNRSHSPGTGDAPGTSLLLQGDDLAEMGVDLERLGQSARAVLALLPAIEAGTDGVHDDPCRQSDEQRKGSDYSLWVSWSGCKIPIPPHGRARLDGTATIEGSIQPDPRDVEEILDRVRRHVPAIDSWLFDAGGVESLSTLEASFDLHSKGGALLLRVLNEEAALLHFENDLVIDGISSIPFHTGDDRPYELRVELHLDVGLTPAAADTAAMHRPGEKPAARLAGIAFFDLFELGDTSPDGTTTSRVVETVTFAFNGTSRARFTLEVAQTGGTLDLETGQVTFD